VKDKSYIYTSLLTRAALILNLIIFGLHSVAWISDQIRYIQNYEVYKRAGYFSFSQWMWVFGLPLVAIFSAIGLFRVRWAALFSTLAGLCFFFIMTLSFIDWYFDPMEQGRNGGVLNLALKNFCFAGFNLSALILLIKRKY